MLLKAAPYFRFVLVILILINFIRNGFSYDVAPKYQILTSVMTSIIAFTFMLYCLLEGIQEIKKRRFIHAIFFRIFGILFTLLLLLIQILTSMAVLSLSLDFFVVAYTIVFGLMLLFLLIVDIRKLFF